MTMQDPKQLLQITIDRKASDLHMSVGRPATLRIRGNLENLGPDPLKRDEVESFIKTLTPDRNYKELNEIGTSDYGLAHESGGPLPREHLPRAGRAARGVASDPNETPQLRSDRAPRIGEGSPHPPARPHSRDRPHGLGQDDHARDDGGLDQQNPRMPHRHDRGSDRVLSSPQKSIVTQREVGNDTPTFSEAMRRVLRQDPDVILLGEMRDLETISSAITAAETGHLVLGTLHTTGAARTVDRVIDAYPTNQQEQIRAQLSVSLLAVISQILIPRADASGLVAAFEVLLSNSAVENHIRKNETFKIASVIQTNRRQGMILLDDFLMDLVKRTTITRETAVEYAQLPRDLEGRLPA